MNCIEWEWRYPHFVFILIPIQDFFMEVAHPYMKPYIQYAWTAQHVSAWGFVIAEVSI